MATGRRSVARRLLLLAAVAAALVAALVTGVLLLVDSAAVTRRVVDHVLPQASTALGREVAVTGAELDLFPEARVSLRGLTVAGRPGEPGLVAAESLDVRIGLWPLLRSLGKDVEVRSLELVKPTVNLVRAKDGTWNYEGLGGGGKPAPEPPAKVEAATRVVVERVRVEKAVIRLVDRSAGRDDAGVALAQLDLEATGVGPGLPFEVRVAAALASAHQNIHARLSVDHLPEGVPRRPEDWPLVAGALEIGALPLDRFRALLPAELGAIVRGGTASLDARVTTGEGRAYKVDGSGGLKDVRLRGQPASGHFRATAIWSPARPDASRVDLTELALRGPGVDLGGHASLETSPVAAWFVVTGSLLDLDAVMGLVPERPEKEAPPPGGDLVPAPMREQLRAARVRGTVALAEVRSGRLQAKDVKARVSLVKGVLTLEELDAAVFGGRVSGAGTRIALGEKVPTWRLAAKLSALDLGGALQAFAGAQPLTGKLDGSLDVVGEGTDWEKLRQALTGLAALAVRDGALVTTDLGDAVLGGVAQGLERLGHGGSAREVSGAKGRTEFKNLAGEFDVKDGFLVARAPVTVDTPFGKLALRGRVGLDGRLALEGTAAVPKAALARIAPGGLPLPQTLDVPLALGGTLRSPTVSVRTDAAVAGLARGQAQEAVKGARKAEERGRSAVEGLLKGLGGKR